MTQTREERLKSILDRYGMVSPTPIFIGNLSSQDIQWLVHELESALAEAEALAETLRFAEKQFTAILESSNMPRHLKHLERQMWQRYVNTGLTRFNKWKQGHG